MDVMSPRWSGTTWLLSVKMVLLSTAALSTAVAASLLAPAVLRLASSEVPRVYVSLQAWMTPPFVYVVINGIIITIAASSCFQKSGRSEEQEEELPRPVKVEAEERRYEGDVEELRILASPTAACAVAEPFGEVVEVADPLIAEEEEGEIGLSRSSWGALRGEEPGDLSTAAGDGKPPASARFGGRRSGKGNTEGKPLGVARPRRNETLESTWKTITDGRSMPLARHLKKSDTWETQVENREPTPTIKKSGTFNEKRRSTTLRREPSLSQDELNKRVEAFIQKFNEEMRLQRQESLQQYWDRINGGNK